MWWTLVKTSKLEIEGRVGGGQISTEDEADFPLNANLPGGEGKRGDERVVRSCLYMMCVWGATCPTPWADSRWDRSAIIRAWIARMGIARG